MRVSLVGSATATNVALASAWRAVGVDADITEPRCGGDAPAGYDAVLLRLDVLPTLDGMEPCPDLARLYAAGVHVLNRPQALLGAHDKRETARRLSRAGVPHPRSACITALDEPVPIRPPVVVKPPYGSWGRDVFRCRSEGEFRRCLGVIADRPWFRRHGALVQEHVPGVREDLRLVVAGGRVIGAARRRPARGEWRTNVSLGGTLIAGEPDDDASRLALAATAAVGGDLVGVDLLPLPGGGYVVLELNGAVDFDERYALPGTSVFVEAATALGLAAARSDEAGDPEYASR